MGRTCTICRHPERAAIDAELIDGAPVLRTAKLRGISRYALDRHKAHLPVDMAKAREAGEVARADILLAQIRDLKDRAVKILTKAERAKKWPVALGAIREARQTLELLGKISGELDERPQINVLISASWISLRGEILAALVPFPEARVAVAGRLADLEGQNAGNRPGPGPGFLHNRPESGD